MINYHDKIFTTLSNSTNGSIPEGYHFHYHQDEDRVFCSYANQRVKQGHLLGLVNEDGVIEMSYHQVNFDGSLKTGICTSTPEILADGRIRLYESWQWTNGDLSSGKSILEEVKGSR